MPLMLLKTHDTHLMFGFYAGRQFVSLRGSTKQQHTAALHVFGYDLESGGNESDVSPAATLK